MKLSEPPRSIIGMSAIIALLSASCCVLPIGLTMLGLGGAWLTLLGPFATYREPILVFVTAIVGWTWIGQLKRRSRKRVAGLALTFIATLSLALAWSAPLWEQTASRALWNVWVNM